MRKKLKNSFSSYYCSCLCLSVQGILKSFPPIYRLQSPETQGLPLTPRTRNYNRVTLEFPLTLPNLLPMGHRIVHPRLDARATRSSSGPMEENECRGGGPQRRMREQ
jgi:hypothetical protein